MARYTKAESTAATKSAFPLPNTCDGCPKVNTSSSSSANNSSNADVLISTIGQLNDLKKDVQQLQEESKRTASFYQSSTKLNNTVRTVIIILMIVPVLQLIGCTCVVYALGIEDTLPNLLKWTLSGVSILSILELIVGGIKLYLYENRINELEKEIEKLKTDA